MKDVEWTPGPWLVIGSIPEEGSDCFWIKAQPHPAMRGFTKDIGTIDGYQDDPERAANARLVATAPELYEALSLAVAKLKEYAEQDEYASGYGGGCFSSPNEFIEAVVDQCNAALAKARGES